MSREKSEKAGVAKELFDSGLPLADIAKQLGVSAGTVRSWKSRYGWGMDRNATLHKKQTQRCKGKRSEKKEEKDGDFWQSDEVLENSDLTDKQRLFCILYTQCFNATKAYQRAYEGCTYNTAAVEGCRTLRNPKIREEIKTLKQNRFDRELLTAEDIVQKFIDIAFADIKEYLKWGKHGVQFIDSSEVDGTLITEIKWGKNGTSVKLSDRISALRWLAEHMDMATEKQRAEIALLKVKAGECAEGSERIKEQAQRNIESILSQLKAIEDGDVVE